MPGTSSWPSPRLSRMNTSRGMAMISAVLRTAHSGIVRDSLVFSASLCDALGQPLAQGVCTPMHLGSFYDAMRKLLMMYEGRIYPEDIFISNDPYEAAGQHLPDIYIAK